MEGNCTVFTQSLRRSLWLILFCLAMLVITFLYGLHPDQLKAGHSIVLRALQRAGPTSMSVFLFIFCALSLFAALYFTVTAIRHRRVIIFDRHGVRFGTHDLGWDEIAVVRPTWLAFNSGVVVFTKKGKSYPLLATGLSGKGKDIQAGADYWRRAHDEQQGELAESTVAGSSATPAA